MSIGFFKGGVLSLALVFGTMNSFAGITKGKAESIIEKVKSIYVPYALSKGNRKLEIKLKWNVKEFGGQAGTRRGIKVVQIAGGTAEHSVMNADSFALIVCHEVGHHYGGLPLKYNLERGITDVTAEGVSDYFAISKCLRKVFASDNNVAIARTLNAPEIVVRRCSQTWRTEEEIALCMRTAMAGLVAVRATEANKGIGPTAFFNTPSNDRVVESNIIKHPKLQCRLDTYLQASLCNKGHDLDPTTRREQDPKFTTNFPFPIKGITKEDVDQGYCARSEGYVDGVRPRCWYNPNYYHSYPTDKSFDRWMRELLTGSYSLELE